MSTTIRAYPSQVPFPSAFTILLSLIVIVATLTWDHPRRPMRPCPHQRLPWQDCPMAGTYAPDGRQRRAFFDVILAPIAGVL